MTEIVREFVGLPSPVVGPQARAVTRARASITGRPARVR